MSKKQKIEQDKKDAMKGGDALRLSTLRMLWSAIQNKEIELRGKGTVGDLGDDEVMQVVRVEAKKRRDAIVGFRMGGHVEAADQEATELKVLEAYLPAEMDDEKLRGIIRNTVSALGDVTQNDFGRVMGEVMKHVTGQASGDRVSAAVKEALSATG